MTEKFHLMTATFKDTAGFTVVAFDDHNRTPHYIAACLDGYRANEKARARFSIDFHQGTWVVLDRVTRTMVAIFWIEVSNDLMAHMEMPDSVPEPYLSSVQLARRNHANG